MKIAVFKSLELEKDQIERLEKLGEIVWIDKDNFNKDSFDVVDVICAEEPISRVIYDLSDKMVSFPFVGVGWLDLEKLTENAVKVANAPGCNKVAVSEWILAMMLILGRKLMKYIDIENVPKEDFLESMPGLAGKTVAVLGKGNIGNRVGMLCEAFEMKVKYYTKDSNLYESVKDADYIVNCLARNDETVSLLDQEFFSKLKNGAFFISITDAPIYDMESMLRSLNKGALAGAAIDPAGIPIFDAAQPVYQELRNHPKVLVTPHIAFHTDTTLRVANDIMIDNVEAWIKGNPTNIVN